MSANGSQCCVYFESKQNGVQTYLPLGYGLLVGTLGDVVSGEKLEKKHQQIEKQMQCFMSSSNNTTSACHSNANLDGSQEPMLELLKC